MGGADGDFLAPAYGAHDGEAATLAQ